MKLKLFQEHLQEKDIDFAFFHNLESIEFDPNIFYFSRYTGAGVLLIPKSGKPVLIVPGLDELRAKKTSMQVVVWGKKRLFEVIDNVIINNHWKKENVGIDESKTSVFWQKMIKKNITRKIADVKEKIVSLRREKTKEEIEILKESCKIKCAIFEKTLDNFSTFKTESDLAAYFQYLAAKKGFALSFPTIVGSGKNASFPHHETANTKLQKGFCVIDCGIRYKHYCTDMTRTIFIGAPSKKEKEIYQKIRDVQESVMNLYQIGAKTKDLDLFVRKKLGNLERFFNHGLGHGVGLDVHEAPSIGTRSKEVLQEFDYVTNEPGIYLPNKLGIRIEDDVLITKEGPEVLTKYCTKDLRVFK